MFNRDGLYSAAAAVLVLLTFSGSCFAQTTSPPPAVPNPAGATHHTLLDLLRYDPATEGPLISVEQTIFDQFVNSSSPRALEAIAALQKTTPQQFAEGSKERLLKNDTVSALVPSTERVIKPVPTTQGDPFAGLPVRERFTVLLSLFTPQQWEQASSTNGIGPADMTDEQRSIWQSFLPQDGITVQKNARVPEGNRSYRFEPEGTAQTFAPAEARLRLVRRLKFQFQKLGAEDYGYMSGTDGPVGDSPDTEYSGNFGNAPDELARGENVNSFGATVMETVPNHQKKSDLDFDIPALAVAVPLGASSETVGELLQRIGAIVHIELLADKRVANLRVDRRVAPGGSSVAARDLLPLLCMSVTGTFRGIPDTNGNTVYLLTDDREGIATRLLRWEEWGEEADQKRYDAVHEATKKAAASNPLGLIGFAPGDPNALPPDLLARVDAAYRKEQYAPAPEVSIAELPTTLQKTVRDAMQYWTTSGTALNTSKMRLGTGLTCQLLLPGGIAVEPASYGRDFDNQYLQEIAAPERPRTTKDNRPEPAAKPIALPAIAGRRALLLPFPIDAAERSALLRTARRKGFTEIWLRVALSDDAAATRLAQAVKEGTRLGIRIGAVVDVLRGYTGTPDINIFGETGAEYSKRQLALRPDQDDIGYHYPNWSVFDEPAIVRYLRPIASVPHLAALALQATAAPGYAGIVVGGDGIFPSGYLGYTNELRLACIRSQGFDPVDTCGYIYTLGISPDLPFFQQGTTWDELATFRYERNKTDMVRLYGELKEAAPALPLFLSDRASSYATPNTTWYVRWADAGRIAIMHVFAGASEAREVAFAASPEPLLNRWTWKGKPGEVASAIVTATADAKQHWRGMTVDASYLSQVDAMQMLGGFADAPAKP